jgi:hypothetical protein
MYEPKIPWLTVFWSDYIFVSFSTAPTFQSTRKMSCYNSFFAANNSHCINLEKICEAYIRIRKHYNCRLLFLVIGRLWFRQVLQSRDITLSQWILVHELL